jgi:hypothetical protein
MPGRHGLDAELGRRQIVGRDSEDLGLGLGLGRHQNAT